MDRQHVLEKFYYLFPQTVAIIGIAKNLMPAAWHTPISSQPPLYGTLISPKRHTYALAEKEQGFTVNFLMHEQADLIARLGHISGRDVDKINELGISCRKAEKVNGMLMSDAYGAYECEKYGLHEYGDHFLLVGKVISIHISDKVVDKAGQIDMKAIRPALYFGKDQYITIDPDTLSIHKG